MKFESGWGRARYEQVEGDIQKGGDDEGKVFFLVVEIGAFSLNVTQMINDGIIQSGYFAGQANISRR